MVERMMDMRRELMDGSRRLLLGVEVEAEAAEVEDEVGVEVEGWAAEKEGVGEREAEAGSEETLL